MQDWDTRIKNLKNDIQIAREKYVIPFTKEPTKKSERAESNIDNQNTETNTEQQEAVSPQEKLYVNNDPISSFDSISKKEGVETVSKEETQTTAINEQAVAEEAPTVDINKVLATEETSTEVINEEATTEEIAALDNSEVASAEETPTVDINEVPTTEETSTEVINEEAAIEEIAASDNNEVAIAEETQAADTNEESKTDEVSTENDVEENIQEVENDTSENKVKKTELELLEERGEDNLSDEEVDRMYELRLLRSQKNMNNELREQEQEELKKADEEIAHLKTLLKPKPKKLPKGYVE